MPATKSRPTKKQLGRRVRPSYPVLKRGERQLVDRGECGVNNGRPTPDDHGKPVRYTLRGKFIYQRPIELVSRSKYDPAREDEKKGRRQ